MFRYSGKFVNPEISPGTNVSGLTRHHCTSTVLEQVKSRLRGVISHTYPYSKQRFLYSIWKYEGPINWLKPKWHLSPTGPRRHINLVSDLCLYDNITSLCAFSSFGRYILMRIKYKCVYVL